MRDSIRALSGQTSRSRQNQGMEAVEKQFDGYVTSDPEILAVHWSVPGGG